MENLTSVIRVLLVFLTSNRSCTPILVFVCQIEVKMGTYTTNYQLYMPTVGETGWGTLINGNYQTIDSTMKSLSNRITAVENEVNGALSCTSVTTSGKITGNGGIAGTTGTFSGAVTGASFNGVPLKTSITVTPNNTHASQYGFINVTYPICILAPMPGRVYNGTIRLYYPGTDNYYIYYVTDLIQDAKSHNVGGGYTNITLTNAKCLYLRGLGESTHVCGFTLT